MDSSTKTDSHSIGMSSKTTYRRQPQRSSNQMNGEQEHSFSSNHGLDTKDALLKLHLDIEQELARMKQDISKRGFLSLLSESISFKSELSKIRWPSVFFMTAQAIAHFIVAFVLEVDNLATEWVGTQGFILTALLILNLSVNLWDTKIRFRELLMKSEEILHLIEKCSRDKRLLKKWTRYSWDAAQPKRLFVPKSPCVHQTLAYRDNSCLNLPDFLLVKGDIIHLFPGERAPGDCVSLKTLPNTGKVTLTENQIFHDPRVFKVSCKTIDENLNQKENSTVSQDKTNMISQFSHAKLKKAHNGVDFLMLSTPYVKSLRISLIKSHKRPVNSVEKECFIITRKYFETIVIPTLFLMSTIVTAIHYGYLDLTDNDHKIKTVSIAHLLLRPSLTVMPFLPWLFPCLWLAVNAYGSARLLCCGEVQRRKLYNRSGNTRNDSPCLQNLNSLPTPSRFENLLATPTAGGSSENKHDEDELNELKCKIKFLDCLSLTKDLIMGRGGHVWRSSNLLQVLGCLTSLCCIDKVGILSWSNPTPEKIFVLTKDEDEIPVVHEENYIDQLHIASDEHEPQAVDNISTDDAKQPSEINRQVQQAKSCHPEILDVSQALSCYRGFGVYPLLAQQHSQLQFDDLNWRKYIHNLKPLGLAIMMSNCCEKSFGDYFRFYKHISYKSILACNLTPVVKRRCVCALSKLIGFTNDAIKNYEYIDQIGIYKLIDPHSIKKANFVTTLENTTRLKLPFSNMICNIHQDINTGGYQAFSQGTADIILDACIEFWSGHSLVPLDESAKKKIMDFYHRTSLTSYCSAFSYTPLLKAHQLDKRYIELPPEHSKFAPHFRKLINEQHERYLVNQMVNLHSCSQRQTKSNYAATNKSNDNDLSDLSTNSDSSSNSSDSDDDPIDYKDKDHKYVSRTNIISRRHLSMEGLYQSLDFNDSKHHERSKKPLDKNRRLNDAMDELTDQVFVGMVSKQYQACPDFVSLVEQLEHACIRFVHFSKENELRSRVFSEKMGLESGWNCHISLQSDHDLDAADKIIATTDSSTKTTNMSHRRVNQDNTNETNFSPSARVAKVLKGCSKDEEGELDNDQADALAISSDERTLYSWKSLPSLVMQLTTKLFADSAQRSNGLHDKRNKMGASSNAIDSGNECKLIDSDEGQDTVDEQTDNSNKDEAFESLAFDMSNRAKLPKGIENIRPHLETVDNIPLQVSLFTDCTPALTKEMIEIMQDYGEIVCVIGSASSRSNTQVFLQANASIAIEPLMPQCCTRQETVSVGRPHRRRRRYVKTNKTRKKLPSSRVADVNQQPTSSTVINIKHNPRDRLGMAQKEPVDTRQPRHQKPTPQSRSNSSDRCSISTSCSSSDSDHDFDLSSAENELLDDSDNRKKSNQLIHELPNPEALASRLASLPCSYSYNRKNSVNLYSLIMEARHFTFKMKNTFVCMICFALSISSAQFLATILFLPPMLSSGLTIWLTIVVVPAMSFSLMSTTMDTQVMKIAVGKNLQLKPENITFFVICYLIKFIPSIIVVVLCFGLIIAHSCKLTGFGSSSLGPCWMFTYVQHGNTTNSESANEDLLWSTHLLTAQVCAAFLLVVYFVVISAGFVHRSQLMWRRSPTKNHFWVTISLLLIFGQVICSRFILQLNLGSSEIPYEFIASLPLHIWIISFTWPVLIIGINLLVKRAEIKATIRQQRRARFDFNTKLGMNSPF